MVSRYGNASLSEGTEALIQTYSLGIKECVVIASELKLNLMIPEPENLFVVSLRISVFLKDFHSSLHKYDQLGLFSSLMILSKLPE